MRPVEGFLSLEGRGKDMLHNVDYTSAANV
jgi:hypothetical protein